MHQHPQAGWRRQHAFGADKRHLERRTLIVVVITLATMAAEILFGWLANSMALLADGWHMGTHAFALGVSLAAYVIARRHADNRRFAFGTWKVEILGAYTSALVLGIVSLMMVYASAERLVSPLHIHYNQALLVAAIGLVVNLVCALILNGGPHAHGHHHDHGHNHDHDDHDGGHSHAHHAHDDLNYKSAYLHVVADALTSVFAIGALIGAKYAGLTWLDPVMGIAGAALIARWAFFLLRDSASILLDHEKETPLSQEVRECVEGDGDTTISDLHLWRVGEGRYACIIALFTGTGRSIEEYRRRLDEVHELAHVTIEVNERAAVDGGTPREPSSR